MEKTQTKKSVFEKPFLSTKIKSSQVTLFPEAGLGYLVGPLLALISNGVVNIWLIQYWNNVLMLGTWNPLFETLLPIISSIIIIIGNLVVGRLMEKKPSLAGKARPFILLGMPFIAVALLVLFLVPIPTGATWPNADGTMASGTFNNVFASILIAIGYNLYYAVAWPLYYTSHSAIVNMSTRDGGGRGLLSTCIMAAQLAAAGLSGMAGGILVDKLHLLPIFRVGDQKFNSYAEALEAAKHGSTIITEISPAEANEKWTVLMIIMIVCLVIGCLLEYYFTRERITEENVRNAQANENDTPKKGITMGQQAKICIHDKYWWLIIVFFFLYQFGGQMKNNDMSFYSQKMTNGDSTLSSLINTVGAIPTAVGMLLVWPLANKFSKSKTIIGGCLLAFAGSLISLIALTPSMVTNMTAVSIISVSSFIVKALGTAPAMYLSLALLANVLDHQEAMYGKRTDGFTMAVYGSIMVAMSGICNGIIVLFNDMFKDVATARVVHTVLGFIVEGVCYLIMGIMFLMMNVEKFTKLDNQTIVNNQKEKCLAEGKEWIEPSERAKLEDAENARLVEEARVAQLKADCEKKHLNFEAENQKFLEAKKAKDAQAAAKKAEADKKKAEALAKKQAEFDALPEEKKAAILAKKKMEEEKVLEQFNKAKEAAKNSGLAA